MRAMNQTVHSIKKNFNQKELKANINFLFNRVFFCNYEKITVLNYCTWWRSHAYKFLSYYCTRRMAIRGLNVYSVKFKQKFFTKWSILWHFLMELVMWHPQKLSIINIFCVRLKLDCNGEEVCSLIACILKCYNFYHLSLSRLLITSKGECYRFHFRVNYISW